MICIFYLGGILYIVLIKREILILIIKKKFLFGLIIKRGVFKIFKYLIG